MREREKIEKPVKFLAIQGGQIVLVNGDKGLPQDLLAVLLQDEQEGQSEEPVAIRTAVP